ncbi:MAG TPA: glutathione S-transferase family protein [Gammaproteobacteria bacterium]|nr:glutathione S-transferase family protein [Gammaproteobacteria bacterium]
MPSRPELISFNVCPFVQRSVITLLEKQVEFKLTHVDLGNLPAWFLALSPLGKVPVLRVGDAVLFESAVINEYLDEVYPPVLHPADPLERAHHRAWIEFSAEMIMTHYNMITAKEPQSFETCCNQLRRQFVQLGGNLGVGPYFGGEKFSLVDAAIAPLFMRIDLLEEQYPLRLYAGDSRVGRWAHALNRRKSVKESVSHDFEEVFRSFVASLESVYSRRIPFQPA